MVNYLKAKLVSWKRINIVIFTDMPRPEKLMVSLYKENKLVKKEAINHFTSINNLYILDISLDEDYELNREYRLLVGDLPYINIDTSEAVYFADFDERFYYDGDDLGNVYTKQATTFALWAPLAKAVTLRLIAPDGKMSLLPMNYDNKGIYRLKVDGDILNYKYRYIIDNNGVITEARDLYAKEMSLNSEYSVVIDLKELAQIKSVSPKTTIKIPTHFP